MGAWGSRWGFQANVSVKISSPTLLFSPSGLPAGVFRPVMASVVQNSHPFYPLEADIVGYLANESSVPVLLTSFALGCALVLGGTLVLLRLNKPLLGATEKAIILWFMLSKYFQESEPDGLAHRLLRLGGTIHLFFEGDRSVNEPPGRPTTSLTHLTGYFALNHTSMAGKQDLFGQLWKEYSFSDSRYLTSDPFVLCMETITAVCTSSCLIVPLAYASTKSLLVGMLGTALVPCCIPHCCRKPPAPSAPSHGFPRPNLRRRVVFRHQHVRPLSQRSLVLQARSILLLDLLFLHEYYLDCGSWQ